MTVDDMLASNNPEHAKLSKKQKIIAWGFPGHMSQAELDIYVSFLLDRFCPRRGRTWLFRSQLYFSPKCL